MAQESSSQSYISIKCRNLSFAAIVAVVLIHSNSLVTVQTAQPWAVRFCDLVCLKTTCWAVPFFFLTSGYWFGKGEYIKTGSAYPFFKKKFATLGVPYVVFVLLGLVSLYILHLSYIFILGATPNKQLIWSYDILGFTRILPHGNGPLWFLRSLIIIFALAPVWRFCLRRCRYVLLLLGLTAMISPPLVIDGYIPFRIGQASFFFWGVFLSGFDISVTREIAWHYPKTYSCLCCLCSICFLGWAWLVPYGIPRTGLMPLSLLVVVWLGYDAIVKKGHNPCPLASYVFWIFCSHMILLDCILPIVRLMKISSSIMLVVVTFVCCFVTLAIDIGIGSCLKVKIPRLYNIAVGNR